MKQYAKNLKESRERLYVRHWRLEIKGRNIITKLKLRNLKKINGKLTFKFQNCIFHLECLQSLGTYYGIRGMGEDVSRKKRHNIMI